jgi:P27 family predicted phage terminase small subunit
MPKAQTKPNAIKRLEGNPGKRRIPQEVIAPGRLPPPPGYLTDEQKARWDDIVRALPPGLLATADESAVERAAVSWAAYREITALINGQGPGSFLMKRPDGTFVASPLYQVRAKLSKEMTTAAFELGLSPLARSRMTAADADDSDPYATLLGPTGLAWTDYGKPQ